MLIVDAFSGSQAGRAAFRKFDELVRSAFRLVERQEHGRTEFLVRHFTKGLEVCVCAVCVFIREPRMYAKRISCTYCTVCTCRAHVVLYARTAVRMYLVVCARYARTAEASRVLAR